jgi:hypothetical protein
VETPTREEALEWEARQGPRAAIAAGIGALLVVVPTFLEAALFKDRPRAGLADSLARAGAEGGVGSLPSLRTPFFEFYDDHALQVLGISLARGLGLIAVSLMIAYLARAVRNRVDTLKPFWIWLTLTGGVVAAISSVWASASTLSAVSDFLDGAHTVDRADAVGDSNVGVIAQSIGQVGSLLLALGWVITCLNAMRIGLLTRFMGIIGIICGVVLVLPIFTPVIQTFWLAAMALLLAGRWPNGVPPAWTSGEAVPWPSSAEAREQRRRQIDARRRDRDREPEPEPDPEDPRARAPHAATSRKKSRKRRN